MSGSRSSSPLVGPVLERAQEARPLWLTGVLRACGDLQPGDPQIAAVDVEPLTGRTADTARLLIRYDPERPPGAPASLIVKTGGLAEPSRAAARLERRHERESGFYRDLAERVPVRVPRCAYLGIDPENDGVTILLEDLAPRRGGDDVAGLTVEDAAVAVDELARVHAAFWADEGLAALPWLDVRPALDADRVTMLPQRLQSFAERHAGELGADVVGLATSLVPHLPAYLAAAERAPLTLQHGDLRPSNLLFGPRDGRERLALLDWQTVARGPAAADVSALLGSGLEPDDRRAAERDLVGAHHARLRELGVEGYEAQDAWRDYRLHALGGFLQAMSASTLIERTPAEEAGLVAIARRRGAQARDLEVARLLQ